MNLRLVSYNLGIISLLIAFVMVFSMVWALPCLGGVWEYEYRGVTGLALSILVSSLLSFFFFSQGKEAKNAPLFRREAYAIVGLGWVTAAILASLPYLLSETCRGVDTPMSVVDALFESVSGLTTSGATICSELEDPRWMPRCILFWRSTTHFIGGLGIIVLLVALLDTGMSGKSLVQRELTGPRQNLQSYTRTQMIVRRTVSVYLLLNLFLTMLLIVAGLSFFDALCHSFGTIATGGLGTYNDSLIHFRTAEGVNFRLVEWGMATFMFLAGMNLLGLFFVVMGNGGWLFRKTEWQVYVWIAAIATLLIFQAEFSSFKSVEEGLRVSFLQVASIITTTGYASVNYVWWHPLSQGILFLLMFVTACSGSTAGGPKVVRYVLLFKILRLETERAYRPTIVRPLYFNGERIVDDALSRSVLLYFAMMLITLMISWMGIMFFEPDTLWSHFDHPMQCKSFDLFSAIVSHYSNVGPGFGCVGPMSNFGCLSTPSKFILLCDMLLGRLDFFAILLLFSPTFWKK